MDDTSRRFPLSRTGASNEKAMKDVFLANALALTAAWISDPSTAAFGIGRFAAVLAVALIVDLLCNLARFGKFICSVSAAVTAAVVCALAPPAAGVEGVTLAGIAVAIALLFGKHAFGGTGKNVFNPAMLALAVLWGANAILDSGSPIPLSVNAFSFLSNKNDLIPLIVLFVSAALMVQAIRFRPFAAVFFFAGAVIAVAARFGSGGFSGSVIANALFWSCIVMTDPVTVTRNPVPGAIFGFCAGIVPQEWWPLAVLAINAVSFVADAVLPARIPRRLLRLKRAVRFVGVSGLEEIDRSSSIPIVGNVISSLSPETVLSRIAESAIDGRGGAGFPSAAKIDAFRSSFAPRKVLIVNAVECDPGLVHDKWLLANRGREIAEGIVLVLRACGISEAILAVKNGTEVSGACSSAFPDGVLISRVPNRYPAGAERILVRRVTGTALSPDSVPAREGFLVLNVQTVCAIRDAALAPEGIPPAIGGGKLITVAEFATRSAKAVLVASGERLVDIAAREFPGTDPVFAGGGLMQAWRAGDTDVVDRNVNFIARGKTPHFKESPQCSRCGRCSDACPAGLDVRRIADAVDAGELDDAKRLGSDRCLSCGGCAMVCLAGKNLSRRTALAKEYSRGGSV
jgi:ferredoxin